MRRLLCFVLLAVFLLFTLSPQAVIPVWSYRTVRRLHRFSLQQAAITTNVEITAEEELLLHRQIEEARAVLKKEFGWDPHSKLRLVFDPKLQTRGVSGYYQLGAIVVASAEPILHEMTHLAVDYLAHGNYPAWLTEGIAMYVEVKYQGWSWIDVREQRVWHSVSLLDTLLQSSSVEVQAAAYWQSFVIVDYLYSLKPYGIRELLGELGLGETLEISLLKVYNLTVAEIAQQAMLSLHNQQEAVR